MPKINRRHVARREWTADHKDFLRYGLDVFRCVWGREPKGGWPADMLDEMRLAWEHFRDELLAEHADKLGRPWAWWKFEADEKLLTFWDESTADMNDVREAEALDRGGLLSPAALEKAASDRQAIAGLENESWPRVFRRSWHWWRFVSPELRDYCKPEAVQLVEVERRGGEVLNAREKAIAETKADPMAEQAAAFNVTRVFLSSAEVEVLGLPESFIEPIDQDDDE
ncbi:MAG TPA: hypothetical protein VHX65_10445 [Pirellulales bacterium]|jgi:hypothetical protein|nr:hypothetical protein [Pirellulales bacterium]